MDEPQDSERQTPGRKRAFWLELERILPRLLPLVLLGAAVSSLSELLLLRTKEMPWSALLEFLQKAWPVVLGVIAAVGAAAAAAALAQAMGRKRGETVLLTRQMQHAFDEALVLSLGRSLNRRKE